MILINNNQLLYGVKNDKFIISIEWIIKLFQFFSPITQFLGRQTGTGEFQVIMILYKDVDYEEAYQTPPHLTAEDQ